ncbi:MAG: guanosine polyphosphate pyrophosphohydrolase [Eubacteriales bacterium]|nr:guanosine polyphosphate pyrophosphohydrolase [Eubacteriales bacterium]
MITLNDYLYSGDTIFQILHNYADDLQKNAIEQKKHIDLVHSNFLMRQIELLENNDFLSSQSQRIREFYVYMVKKYPFLAFTFKGRIKSIIRSEEKYNRYIVENLFNHYQKTGEFLTEKEVEDSMKCIRDLIAYRIVISLPECHMKNVKYREKEELHFLYEIANALPAFLEERGFSVQLSNIEEEPSIFLNKDVRPYFRDYIQNPSDYGYRSLHITFYDNLANCYIEVQLRTKDMDDYAKIGPANHLGYEKRQENELSKRDIIPEGRCSYFDDAWERGMLLQQLDLSKVNVNMFTAYSNTLVNDACGLYRGRLILPFEHLSRYQKDSEWEKEDKEEDSFD